MQPVAVLPRVLDGLAIAAEIKSEVALSVASALQPSAGHHPYTPGLAVVLVGEKIYVRSKVKTCAELGIFSEMITPPAASTTEDLLALVDSLNARDDIDGILIQLPLPAHVDTPRLLEAVNPAKDVDGFHPVNAGRLASGFPLDQVLAPCTPAGVLEALRRSDIPLAGARAVVLGRSNIVGKPVAAMLVNASATVTICHSHTRDLSSITCEADILIAAIGRPGFVMPQMVRPGATIVDVGINRLTSEDDLNRFFPASVSGNEARREIFFKRGSTLVGDVHPAAFALSGAYTPVPGGVGALTIAMLMSNTVKAARMRRKIA
jgi:methylenetetrahydrofolate dehydrogenase (NADP+)/methenyltetrahydrofolate cyclohydrolase